MLVGGGSGGHLTPLLAVADALRHSLPAATIIHVGQLGEQLDDVMQHSSIDESIGITAGKFRRYNGESFLRQLLDVRTVALNIRDGFRFLRGTIQSWRLLGKTRPDAILLKGGFVCVPVGLAARLRKIPYMTHDSDAIPGLANRITSGSARYNAVAMPVDGYPYAADKVLQTGIPIRPEFAVVTTTDMSMYKKELGLAPKSEMLFVVGGGLGARNVNQSVVTIAQSLLTTRPHLHIVQITGKTLYGETTEMYAKLPDELRSRVQLIDFTTEIYKYSAAADVVISRAGATNIAELAVQQKPTILIPNPLLTGGQQLHNAGLVRKASACLIVEEGDSQALLEAVHTIFAMTKTERAEMGKSLASVLPNRHAAHTIADILASLANDVPFMGQQP